MSREQEMTRERSIELMLKLYISAETPGAQNYYRWLLEEYGHFASEILQTK